MRGKLSVSLAKRMNDKKEVDGEHWPLFWSVSSQLLLTENKNESSSIANMQDYF